MRISVEEIRKRLIHLYHCRGIGRKILLDMLIANPSLENIYSYSGHELVEKFHISPRFIHLFNRDLKEKNGGEILANYEELGIDVVTIIDDDYPDILKNIYNPPLVLFLKGDKELLNERKKIAVVGTRIPSDYGKFVTKEIVRDLVKENVTIVSGLAKGIDVEAHKHAISHNGRTIAVLGSGFSHIYPREHEQIAEWIGREHLLISEYPPYRKPQKYHFPERNRIISGLCWGTLVVEAKERSGSLITAEFALNEGRDVFAIPGPINRDTSRGTNYLIQEGAKLVQNVQDIITEQKIKWDMTN